MPSFRHDDVEIAYLDEGAGEPIVLVHGFASTKEVNWVNPGWVTTLTRARPARDRARQSRPWRIEQILRSRRLSQRHDGRGRARAARSSRHRARRRHGLFDGRAHHGLSRGQSSRARAFGDSRRARHKAGRRRRLADEHRRGAGGAVACRRAGSGRPRVPRLRRADPVGLACARRLHPRLAPDARAASRSTAIAVPVLVAVGTKDDIAGSAQELAALIPGAQALDIPDRDHMLAVGDKVFKLACSNSLTNAREPCAGTRPAPPLRLCRSVLKDLCRGSRGAGRTKVMAHYQTRPAKALDKVDPVWTRIRSEAEDVARREPELGTFIYENILHHDSLENAVAHRVGAAARSCRCVGRSDPPGL